LLTWKSKIEKPKKLTTLIKLKGFIIPNTELIPEEVRSKVKRWSDYIDCWAIDWDFQNDTFMQGWVNYRTRKDRSLALASDLHTYEKPGRYRVLGKVVDIWATIRPRISMCRSSNRARLHAQKRNRVRQRTARDSRTMFLGQTDFVSGQG